MAAAKREEITRHGEVPVRGGRGLTSLRDEMNRLMDRFGGSRWPHWGRRQPLESPWSRDPFSWFEWPAVWNGDRELGRADLSETDTGYELQIDLPGMKRDDITVDFSDGILTVAGERSDEHEDKRKGYYLSERSYGSVRRSFRVPDSVETDEIKADFRDGVLTLTMPKSEEAKTSSRRIEIG